ncbi:MAG: polyprenyl synthetase family protein [Phycisphaerae bacterium]|nr:polyprenyl synthetase family protein [Phycisphaerae bacterium]
MSPKAAENTTRAADSPGEALAALLAPCAKRVEADLERWLVPAGAPDALADGMRYCMAGGKRLRPAITMLSARAIGGSAEEELVRRAAAAVEMVHVYSLVHDDLPAMDDDALRRGRPTAHVQFGEAMAILIGDALLTRAFGVLAEDASAVSARLAAELARAAGAEGMVAGQAADMDLCTLPAGLEGLRYIHLHKTAAMIRAAARMGALAAGAKDEALQAVGEYAENLGLAFQLFDDLLDATGTARQLGKTPGKDAETGKRTHLAVLGAGEARRLGEKLTAAARDALRPLGPAGETLKELANLLTQRTH